MKVKFNQLKIQNIIFLKLCIIIILNNGLLSCATKNNINEMNKSEKNTNSSSSDKNINIVSNISNNININDKKESNKLNIKKSEYNYLIEILISGYLRKIISNKNSYPIEILTLMKKNFSIDLDHINKNGIYIIPTIFGNLVKEKRNVKNAKSAFILDSFEKNKNNKCIWAMWMRKTLRWYKDTFGYWKSDIDPSKQFVPTKHLDCISLLLENSQLCDRSNIIFLKNCYSPSDIDILSEYIIEYNLLENNKCALALKIKKPFLPKHNKPNITKKNRYFIKIPSVESMGIIWSWYNGDLGKYIDYPHNELKISKQLECSYQAALMFDFINNSEFCNPNSNKLMRLFNSPQLPELSKSIEALGMTFKPFILRISFSSCNTKITNIEQIAVTAAYDQYPRNVKRFSLKDFKRDVEYLVFAYSRFFSQNQCNQFIPNDINNLILKFCLDQELTRNIKETHERLKDFLNEIEPINWESIKELSIEDFVKKLTNYLNKRYKEFELFSVDNRKYIKYDDEISKQIKIKYKEIIKNIPNEANKFLNDKLESFKTELNNYTYKGDCLSFFKDSSIKVINYDEKEINRLTVCFKNDLNEIYNNSIIFIKTNDSYINPNSEELTKQLSDIYQKKSKDIDDQNHKLRILELFYTKLKSLIKHFDNNLKKSSNEQILLLEKQFKEKTNELFEEMKKYVKENGTNINQGILDKIYKEIDNDKNWLINNMIEKFENRKFELGELYNLYKKFDESLNKLQKELNEIKSSNIKGSNIKEKENHYKEEIRNNHKKIINFINSNKQKLNTKKEQILINKIYKEYFLSNLLSKVSSMCCNDENNYLIPSSDIDQCFNNKEIIISLTDCLDIFSLVSFLNWNVNGKKRNIERFIKVPFIPYCYNINSQIKKEYNGLSCDTRTICLFPYIKENFNYDFDKDSFNLYKNFKMICPIALANYKENMNSNFIKFQGKYYYFKITETENFINFWISEKEKKQDNIIFNENDHFSLKYKE